jgi:hypothetical protein
METISGFSSNCEKAKRDVSQENLLDSNEEHVTVFEISRHFSAH